MHQAVIDFISTIKQRIPERFIHQRVHEIGSLNINGSARQFFEDCDYTGFDLGPGKDVDIVCHYASFPLPCHVEAGLTLSEPDVIISCEALEHDSRWRDTLAAMYGNLKPGGLWILTFATPRRGPHGVTDHLPEEAPFTNDYYGGIDPLDFMVELDGFNLVAYQLFVNEAAGDLQFAGIKR